MARERRFKVRSPFSARVTVEFRGVHSYGKIIPFRAVRASEDAASTRFDDPESRELRAAPKKMGCYLEEGATVRTRRSKESRRDSARSKTFARENNPTGWPVIRSLHPFEVRIEEQGSTAVRRSSEIASGPIRVRRKGTLDHMALILPLNYDSGGRVTLAEL
ncbi:hypothetical protein KM043_003844 [Ampulex compressa]|nr:hypothetical protein KM043_003844 [Ampulex compressa]